MKSKLRQVKRDFQPSLSIENIVCRRGVVKKTGQRPPGFANMPKNAGSFVRKKRHGECLFLHFKYRFPLKPSSWRLFALFEKMVTILPSEVKSEPREKFLACFSLETAKKASKVIIELEIGISWKNNKKMDGNTQVLPYFVGENPITCRLDPKLPV
jgi:hypothetical protein